MRDSGFKYLSSGILPSERAGEFYGALFGSRVQQVRQAESSDTADGARISLFYLSGWNTSFTCALGKTAVPQTLSPESCTGCGRCSPPLGLSTFSGRGGEEKVMQVLTCLFTAGLDLQVNRKSWILYTHLWGSFDLATSLEPPEEADKFD